jgi:hypothetical protein
VNRYTVSAVAFLIVAGVSLSISYRLATAGHPDSLWLWRDILGVLR